MKAVASIRASTLECSHRIVRLWQAWKLAAGTWEMRLPCRNMRWLEAGMPVGTA